MIILLYVILGLLALLLVGYVVNGAIRLKKNSSPKVKIVKEKEKPAKKKDGLIIGSEKPEFRPEVKEASEEEKGAEPPVVVEDLGEPEETEVESTIVKKNGKYIPSWDREEMEEDDEDEDELEAFRHFPTLSHSVIAGDTLSEQIRNLPPEIQAIMLSNIFERKK